MGGDFSSLVCFCMYIDILAWVGSLGALPCYSFLLWAFGLGIGIAK